jgi:nucleoside phosphorylase
MEDAPAHPKCRRFYIQIALQIWGTVANERVEGRLGQAHIAVVTVIREELDAAREVFQAPVQVRGTGYFVPELREDKNYPFVLTKCKGRTNLPASEAVQSVIEDFRPAYLILTGIAGGMNERDGVALGDVVVVDHVSYSEFTKNTPGKVSRRYEPYDHPSLYLRGDIAEPLTMADDWRRFLPEAAKRPAEGQPKAIVGNLVAGEKVQGDPDNPFQMELLETFDSALAVDMESYGFGRGVYKGRRSVHYNPQCLIIRGISDIVEERAQDPARRSASAAAAPDAALTDGARSAEGGASSPLDNNATRKLWKGYAALTAAAFTRAVVEDLLEFGE